MELAKSNLRIILDNGRVSIHYHFTKECSRPCGSQEAGIDKGYTEAVVDSNKRHYGTNFGKYSTEYSKKNDSIMRSRNKLAAIAKKHEAKGNHAKAKPIVTKMEKTKKLKACVEVPQLLKGCIFQNGACFGRQLRTYCVRRFVMEYVA